MGDRPASGLPARGVRLPFENGNVASLRHGAYSTLAISGRARELADEVRAVCPAYAPCDEPLIRLCGLHLARVERAAAALEEVDRLLEERGIAAHRAEGNERFERLRVDLRGWSSTATKMLEQLGCTPTSRAKLGLNVAMTHRALTVVELHAAAIEEGAA